MAEHPEASRQDSGIGSPGLASPHQNGHLASTEDPGSVHSYSMEATDVVNTRLSDMKLEEGNMRRRSASMLEVKDKASVRIHEELDKAQMELKLKDEEVVKLQHVRDQMGLEIEELTASLFEEANKMVQDANVKRMHAEKLLKEAQAKVDILQAEVEALKSLVITSTPSNPNKHLQHLGHQRRRSDDTRFINLTKKSSTHHDFRKISAQQIETPPSPTQQVDQKETKEENKEIDPVFFEEFKTWRLAPSLDTTSPFFNTINREDIQPCLKFTQKQLSSAVLENIQQNTLTMEPFGEKNPFPRKCALTDASRVCKFRVQLASPSSSHVICQFARDRVAAVCDFYTYIRYIHQGLVKSEDQDVYWHIIKLRKQMALSRLGLG
ncbi:unnamed protein product [Owenia fusiformis]|uniref:GDP/GTP exchange factor Sec2 N-terminal domain-containing protein n=1 Tax=Owenia fusiformis TaxID=6347 RepID=A0A8J1XIF6_OWEFU|nr:unnamed protein product [Owenia fusiformis]